MHNKAQNRHLFGLHHAFGAEPINRQAEIETARIDAPKDRQLFTDHLDRPAAPRERRAFGLSPNARISVHLLSDGTQLRIPYEPEQEQ